MGTKCIRATSFSSGKPLADGWPRDAKSLGNGPLRPAFMLQAQRPHPPPLLPVTECREGGVHTSFYGQEQLSRSAQRSEDELRRNRAGKRTQFSARGVRRKKSDEWRDGALVLRPSSLITKQ